MDFSCRRIVIYPKGHNTGYLSIYLSGDLPNFDAWSRFANFKLALINQLNAKKTITAGIFIFQYIYISRVLESYFLDFSVYVSCLVSVLNSLVFRFV